MKFRRCVRGPSKPMGIDLSRPRGREVRRLLWNNVARVQKGKPRQGDARGFPNRFRCGDGGFTRTVITTLRKPSRSFGGNQKMMRGRVRSVKNWLNAATERTARKIRWLAPRMAWSKRVALSERRGRGNSEGEDGGGNNPSCCLSNGHRYLPSSVFGIICRWRQN